MSLAVTSATVRTVLDSPDQTVDRADAIGYQRGEWVAQRIGWGVMTLIVLAAVLGLLGDTGPLARAAAESPDGSLRVEYTRIEHHHSPSILIVTVSPDVVTAGEVRLWIDADYVANLSIDTIIPEPEGVEVGPDRVVYGFTVSEHYAPFEIVFNHEQDGYWWNQGKIGIEGGGVVELRQVVLP